MNLPIQTLIDTGDAWRLEGHVGRQCMGAIETGLAVLGPRPVRDYYGNRIPSRHEVKPGTKGSVLFHHRSAHQFFDPVAGVTRGTAYKNCSTCRRLRKERG